MKLTWAEFFKVLCCITYMYMNISGPSLLIDFTNSMMISKFPVFTGKIEHAHTVCIRPFSWRRAWGQGYDGIQVWCKHSVSGAQQKWDNTTMKMKQQWCNLPILWVTQVKVLMQCTLLWCNIGITHEAQSLMQQNTVILYSKIQMLSDWCNKTNHWGKWHRSVYKPVISEWWSEQAPWQYGILLKQ